MQERELLTNLIHQQLTRAQQHMKSQADKGRSERSFEVGDLVYLKLQPYIQSSVASWMSQKLSFRFFGPFTILRKVGTVAYRLDLPQDCKIHPVVHVSQLKKHIPPHTQVSTDLAAIPSDSELVIMPVAFLDRHSLRYGSTSHAQVLVQWHDLPMNMATWEGLQELHRHYPTAPVWGQPGFQCPHQPCRHVPLSRIRLRGA